MRLIVTADHQALAIDAARLIAETIRNRPDAVLCLPTGLTPLDMYAELVRMHREEKLDFSRVTTFNLDELVGPALYRAYMQKHFFDHVNVPPANIHIPSGSDGTDFQAESANYELAIHRAGGIDLLISGVGANGHVAFNEPGTDFDSRTRVVELASKSIEGLRAQFPDVVDLPTRAITMGLRTILDARRIVLLASGKRKAGPVHQAIDGPATASLPASVLRRHPDVTIILEKDAASLLEPEILSG